MEEEQGNQGASASRPGSREPSPSVSAASGFDPSRVARKLTSEQADELCRHSHAFSPPFNHGRARALWLGIKPKGEEPLFLLQKEHGAPRYRISPIGFAVKLALRGITPEVRRLVVAARMVCEQVSDDNLRALDSAAEAFAADIPWDDEPCDSDGPRMAETNEDSARGEAGPARAEGIAQNPPPANP